MPVASDLQTIIAGVSADIAQRKNWGRTEQEKLRRSLAEIAKEMRRDETSTAVTRLAFEDLLQGVERNAVDLAGLAGHARHVGKMPAMPEAAK